MSKPCAGRDCTSPSAVSSVGPTGKLAFYSAFDINLSEKLAKAFEAAYPGIPVRVERSGAERIFQRIGQEYASNIHAVDVVNSSDAAHLIVWKRDGILAPYVPEDVALHYPLEHRDPDGLFASWRIWLCVIGYNTKLVSAAEAPKSFADLLDPKWVGKIVKAHPGFSGTIMTATFQMARDIGWDYFEKLAQQKVMQVQSSADPPKKLALGERAVVGDVVGLPESALAVKREQQPPHDVRDVDERERVVARPDYHALSVAQAVRHASEVETIARSEERAWADDDRG